MVLDRPPARSTRRVIRRLGREVSSAWCRRSEHAGESTQSLLRVIAHRESRGNPFAVAVENTQGLMQLLPPTAKRFGARNPFDPGQNIDAGARYLRFLLERYGNRLSLALAAYNAGEAAVDRHGGIPPCAETRRFVSRTLAAYREQGGNVAPEAWVRSSVPPQFRLADQECSPQSAKPETARKGVAA